MFFTNKKFIILFIILLLILSAAFVWFLGSRKTLKISLTNQELSKPAITVALPEAEARTQAETENLISTQQAKCTQLSASEGCLRRNLVDLARNLENFYLCEALAGADQDTCLLEVALTTNEPANCYYIPALDKQETCLNLLWHKKAINTNNLELCEQIFSSSYQDSCFKTIVAGWKLNDCAILGERQAECQEAIIMEQAMIEGNPDLCQQLSSESREICLEEMPFEESGVVEVDTDNDGLMDTEEERYGTDPNNSDSDGDGYLDGEEVRNGYNPLGEGEL